MGKTNEPSYQIVLALRGLITSDYNTTRNNVKQIIWKDYPRKDLSKNSYPRISIMDITETGDPVAIGSPTYMENIYVLQIDIWMWDKPNDPLFVTVDSTSMAGTRARDEITRDVLYKLRKNFTTDSNLSSYYDYRVRANRVISFDEDDGILRRSIEIEFKEMDNASWGEERWKIIYRF